MLGLFLVSLFLIMLTSLPIAMSLMFSAVIMLFVANLFDPQIIAQNIVTGTNSFSLLAIPFFVLAGEAMNKGGITLRIVNFVISLVGRIKGGLGYVTIISSIIFAGLSGSAIADTAALGGILIPMMDEQGYKKGRATALVICSSIIANIIPPSIGLIIFGVASGASITSLFIGGVIPGIIIGFSLMVVWAFVCRKDNIKEIYKVYTFKEILKIARTAIWGLLLPVFILIGLRGGVFTPTEAGAIAAAYALLIGAFVYKTIKPSDIFEMLVNTVKTTSSVVFIIAAATLVSWVITARNLPRELVTLFADLVSRPTLLMLVCQLIFLLLGTVMDIAPIILIMTPVLLPLVNAAHISPVYFGIVMIINLTFGLITPPVGTVLYVGSGISKIGIFETLRYAWPFMLMEIGLLVVFSCIPELILIPLSWLIK